MYLLYYGFDIDIFILENMAAAEAIIVSEPHTSSSFISNEMEMAPGNYKS